MRNLITVTLLLGWSAQAAAVTIDFEEFAAGTLAPVESYGYTIDGGGCCGPMTASVSGVMYMSGYTDSEFSGPAQIGFTVSRTDGTAFALYSMDLFGDFMGQNTFFVIRGVNSNGDTIGATSTAELGSGDWLDITSVTVYAEQDFYGVGASIDGWVDNIVVVAAVPIPAAAWLFASGLGLLGWIRKRA